MKQAFCQARGNKGGWPRMKKRNGKEERWSEQVCDLFMKPEEKKLHHLKLSQKGKHGLPSLKWHSHVLPASAAFSLESEWGCWKKKLLKHVEKKIPSSYTTASSFQWYMPARDNDTFTADRIKEGKGGMLKEHQGKPHIHFWIYTFVLKPSDTPKCLGIIYSVYFIFLKWCKHIWKIWQASYLQSCFWSFI